MSNIQKENRVRSNKHYKRRLKIGFCGRCGNFRLFTKTRCKICIKEVREKRWRLKSDIIQAYGGRCLCCDSKILEFLTIEHSLNNGSKDRKQKGVGSEFYRVIKQLGFPKNLGLEVLCMNCNFSKSRYGYCPHKRSRGRNGNKFSNRN